jgi:cytochrome c oxidase cbb3-type subunit 4
MSGTVHGIWTLILMITVLGIYAWAWSSKRVVDFEEAARLPLDTGDMNPEEEKLQ